MEKEQGEPGDWRLKHANRGKKASRPELEIDLLEWITEKCNNGLAILLLMVRLKALQMAKHDNYGIPAGQFKAGNHWCQHFEAAWLVASPEDNTRSTASQWLWRQDRSVPALYYWSSQRTQLPTSMDKTPLTFHVPPNQTIHNMEEKMIKTRTTGNEKNRITVALTCAGDGSKLRPMVIFKRKTILKVAKKHGVVIAAQVKGWMVPEMMKILIKKVWWAQRSGMGKRRSLRVLDAFDAHMTESVKTAITRENTNLAVVLGGLTLQP